MTPETIAKDYCTSPILRSCLAKEIREYADNRNLLVRAEVILDLNGHELKNTRKLFYLYLLLRFGPDRTFTWQECMEYGRGRRTIFRYLADLEEHELITRRHSPGVKSGYISLIQIAI